MRRSFFPQVTPFTDDAARQTFLSITSVSEKDTTMDALLTQLENVPLAVGLLMARLAQWESTEVLLTWALARVAHGDALAGAPSHPDVERRGIHHHLARLAPHARLPRPQLRTCSPSSSFSQTGRWRATCTSGAGPLLSLPMRRCCRTPRSIVPYQSRLRRCAHPSAHARPPRPSTRSTRATSALQICCSR